jgi:hypothetical protein
MHEDPAQTRYDEAMLRKVTALAQRLQAEHQESLTAQEIEAIGSEVGLKPAFMRRAMDLVSGQRPVTPPAPRMLSRSALKGLVGAWWAAGWTIPMILLFLLRPILPQSVVMAFFFAGWAVYIGGGIFLAHATEEEVKPSEGRLSRGALLELLSALQAELESPANSHDVRRLSQHSPNEADVEIRPRRVE